MSRVRCVGGRIFLSAFQKFNPHHAACSGVHGNMCPFVDKRDIAQWRFGYVHETENPNNCDENGGKGIILKNFHHFCHISFFFDAKVDIFLYICKQKQYKHIKKQEENV